MIRGMTLHPSVAAVRNAVRRSLADLEPGARLVVAVSGGADSMALASATVFVGAEQGWYVVGATVDHRLQVGSAEVAAAVVARLAALGVDETLTVRATVDAPGLGPEAAAREARYALLEQVRESYDAEVVLLGHTRDDQAETVLLGLARGSGGRALAGMRRASTTIVARCSTSPTPTRSPPARSRGSRCGRTRTTPIRPTPGCACGSGSSRSSRTSSGPGVTEALARTADQLRPDMELLDSYAADALAVATREGGLSVEVLDALEPPIRTRVLRRAAVAAGAPSGELFHQHVVAVDALVTGWHGQKWVDLPGHLRAVRRDGLIAFDPS